MTDSDHQQTVNATQTSFTIVEALAEGESPIGVTELANSLDLPKSTTHKHLNTLCELGYVRKKNRKYELGISFAGLGEAARIGNTEYVMAKPHIDILAEVTDQTAGILIERKGYAIDLYRAWPSNRPTDDRTNSRYLHCSAPGKAILAELPDDRVDKIIEQTGLPPKTDRTLTTRTKLQERLTQIADRGIAFERGEQRLGHRAVAVPIKHDERVIGAVYVAGNGNRMKSKRFEEDIPGIIISTVNRFVTDM
ncbi:IclR family transcriptional regulator [Halocatena marina]|uniref:IclR family transcriptional regulator n=1 Tax=Halocatena marina TaxID=2934937 RepID=UPI00200F88E3|nr:IclR family transcriptional regulator [Halocatena marina]